MKVTIWFVSSVHEGGGYCFWTKKEALAFVKNEGGRLRKIESQGLEDYDWEITKEVIEGSTKSVCSRLVNWGIECAGGHTESWLMA